jgi:H+/gluconate symporter-like permease
MSFLIAVAALVFLMFVAYRGFSVILFAPWRPCSRCC